MVTEEERLALTTRYWRDQYPLYKSAYIKLFQPKQGLCDCDRKGVYDQARRELYARGLHEVQAEIKKEEIIEDMSRTKNPKQQPKDPKGKFLTKKVKKAEEVHVQSKEEFIREVQQELLSGVFDLERVKQAYAYIVGNEVPANVLLMRRTINAYNNYLN